ncbi:MAG: hypothetical protein TREMPRED_002299 [Tremellales sp. Tagirdzhanova-0007]|nr:MAG: hypothetical protein TREMPRED_002299 [Tremellales sp. Tagirdzhanova-0007]
MCGLTLSIRVLSSPYHQASSPPSSDPIFTSLVNANSTRGPDSSNTYTHTVPLDSEHAIEVSFAASVLGLRGREVQGQPMVGARGVLGWNGQIFDGMDVGVNENDTKAIFERLEAGEQVEHVLRGIEDSTPSDRFILTSTRSLAAREDGLGMRALKGGEGGQIRLRLVKALFGGGVDWAHALRMSNSLAAAGPWVTVSPINAIHLPFQPSCPEIAHQSAQLEVDRFTENLLTALRRRTCNIPAPSPGLAILFSGGLDCTFLTYLAHLCLPRHESIELVNVAFERSESSKGEKRHQPPETIPEAGFDVPDRKSGREALQELRTVCNDRDWRFIEINVPFSDHRQRVLDLMFPSSTEMDLSLAYPLYFASRGIGVLYGKKYCVSAKVFLSGLGADEQLGGYARHRHAFEHKGWQGLVDEIQLDLTRLPTRNLSRDDRIISAHARDVRYPCLDLSFVDYLSSLPIWTKVDPGLGEGVGDKRLLRLAATKVGLVETGRRVKRAMQFGTRSSKMGSNSKRPKAGEAAVD